MRCQNRSGPSGGRSRFTSTVNCDGDSTGGWGSRGTLKRPRKETLATDPCSPSVEGGSGFLFHLCPHLAYAINGFPRFPSTIANVYINFNVRLSLQEGPATKKMRKLSQVLNEDTWKHVEFDYLKVCLTDIRGETVNGFSKLKKEFLAVASPETPKRSPAGLDLFLYAWVKCATAPRWLRPAEPTDKELTEYMRLDDMFSYVIHYHKHHLTVNCLEGTKSHALEVHALEEGVNLLSSVYQLLYWRRDQVYTHLGHKPQQPDFLMDSNGYRKITSFGNSNFRGAQRSLKFEKYSARKSHEETQNSSLQASIIKTKYRLKRYLRKFKSLEPDRKKSYYNLIDHFSILSERLVKEKDHEFAELYSSRINIAAFVRFSS
ncbi:hypothetical protein Pst134EA_017600 [Puccinia striiformis f. sp. tritici]|uniref:hypothetical protein n=1 Tax=Puccinia striiformis f. sp. tritici TaxID=168172 RepID=UPI0020078254|nr:hypothetical protein Pst134EA_017600 [Puccinia striiformis f. sp. tritici]KAH9461292.1 hypothetical protein Pst134EA_017600 [Puccinia striiformis f. sp. tritici]